jgi:hypothetical protein
MAGRHTDAELRTVTGAAAQFSAPVTKAICSYFTIQGILVTPLYHRSSALFIFNGRQRWLSFLYHIDGTRCVLGAES